MGPKTATAVLVLAGIVFGELVHLAIMLVAHPLFTRPMLLCTLVVTVVVTTPVIFYSQLLIRRLIQSRRALRALSKRLAGALDEARAANEAKSQFFANASHELRTPLNAIIGFSEMLSSEQLGPLGQRRYVEYAGDIHGSALHLLSLVNDLLDLASAEMRRHPVPSDAECDLRQIVQEAMHMVWPAAERDQVTLESRIAPELAGLKANERMLKQILLNLLSNAVKFAPGGAVLLTAALDGRGDLIVTAADTGIGMSVAEIAVALKPFGQVNNLITRTQAGTGLGLPLVKAMMELHGGTMRVASEPGRGTTVTLRFPAARIMVRPRAALRAAPG
ncbi:MAG TPA: HAMP domain-containing sensor histidine kinase [Stellaceae bacterium]